MAIIVIRIGGGALVGGGIELGRQMLVEGRSWGCVDWRAVGREALFGAVGNFLPGGGVAVGGLKIVGTRTVYQSVNPVTRAVQYVGITNNIPRRAAEHLRAKGIRILPILGLGDLTRAEARGVEQALIEHHGLSRLGGTLLNRVNSIDPSRGAYYTALVERGKALLKMAGYPGF